MMPTMKVILHRGGDAPWQSLDHDWFGRPVGAPFEFRFRLEADALVFEARRAAPAALHPDARSGEFLADLWHFDTTEFFIAAPSGSPYLEFNLCPNGAWWAAAFTDPRVSHIPALTLEGIAADGRADSAGWACRARLPLAQLEMLGISVNDCRIAAAAILGSPRQVFLTTAPSDGGRPDFHKPRTWETAETREGNAEAK